MGRKKVVAIGFYDKGNVGDEAFKAAFKTLFPLWDWTFRDQVPTNPNAYDAMVIGGGSVLDGFKLDLSGVTIPLGFIGVGLGEDPTGDLLVALQRAKVVVVRDRLSRQHYPAADYAPDLAFTNPFLGNPRPIGTKKVAFFANDFMAAKEGSASWVGDAFNWFTHEAANTCQKLMESGYQITFMPMCIGGIDDRRTAGAVIGRLKNPGTKNAAWLFGPREGQTLEQTVHNVIAESDLVVTQRFHGMVYAAQAGKPFVAISSHDKFLGLATDMGWSAGLVDYYGYQTGRFLTASDWAQAQDLSRLKRFAEAARNAWSTMSATVEGKLFG